MSEYMKGRKDFTKAEAGFSHLGPTNGPDLRGVECPNDLGCPGPVGATEESPRLAFRPSAVSMLAGGAAAYHGYKRTGSIGWAVGWALLGSLVPIVTIPVALAQGFGKKKGR